MWFDSLFYNLGTYAQKDFSPFIAVWLFGTFKSEQDPYHSILTSIYFWIKWDKYSHASPLSTLNVWNRILYSDLKCTVSQWSWNKSGVICSLLWAHVTRHAAQFCTCCRWFVSFLCVLLGWENNEFGLALIKLQHVGVHPSTYICNTSFNWRWTLWPSNDILLCCWIISPTGLIYIHAAM